MNEVEKAVSKVKIFWVLSGAWIVACILFIWAAIAFPQTVLVISCFVLTFFFALFAMLLRLAKSEDGKLFVLDAFLHLLFLGSGSAIDEKLEPDERRRIAHELTQFLSLFAVIGAVTSFAFIFVVLNNNAALRQTSVMSPVSTPTPFSTLTPTPSATSTVTLVVTPTLVALVLNTPTPVPTPVPQPTGSLSFNWSLTNTVPTSLSIEPHSRALQEYEDIINSIVPRVALVGVKTGNAMRELDSDEYIIITNHGSDVDLSGWYVIDSLGNRYVFQPMYLRAGAGLILHTGVGEDTDTHLYWNLDRDVWAEVPQEIQLRLVAYTGAVVDRLIIPRSQDSSDAQ